MDGAEAVVKAADMSDNMQQLAVDCATAALVCVTLYPYIH